MMTKINPNVLFAAILLIISAVLAYALTVFVPFLNAFALISGIILPVGFWIKHKNDNDTILVDDYKKVLEEMDLDLGNLIQERNEMDAIIQDYERIFDTQLLEIECLCGENAFQGLFPPTAETICECEKCKNKYRITMNYESVLISDPLSNEQLFDQLKEVKEEKID